jgi:hypothetical protein
MILVGLMGINFFSNLKNIKEEPAMPKYNKSAAKKKIKQDALVEKIIPDQSVAADVKVFTGFIGESLKEGQVRLYLTPELDEYLEIFEKDILNLFSATSDTNPLAGSVLWIKKKATIEFVKATSRQYQAEFLQGGISNMLAQQNVLNPVFGSGIINPLKRTPTLVVSVCFSCPTSGGEDSCVPATCTLAFHCLTTYLCTQKR